MDALLLRRESAPELARPLQLESPFVAYLGAVLPLHYLAIPQSLFSKVAEQLGRSGCARGGRVVAEKPFGHDLASAQVLSVVRGQFRGYRDEPGIARDSRVETFAAVRFQIDNWRWAGVPFYIRAGN